MVREGFAMFLWPYAGTLPHRTCTTTVTAIRRLWSHRMFLGWLQTPTSQGRVRMLQHRAALSPPPPGIIQHPLVEGRTVAPNACKPVQSQCIPPKNHSKAGKINHLPHRQWGPSVPACLPGAPFVLFWPQKLPCSILAPGAMHSTTLTVLLLWICCRTPLLALRILLKPCTCCHRK